MSVFNFYIFNKFRILGSFLLGVCFLTSAENHKALDLFEIAAKGVQTEPFLQKLINDPSDSQVYINYYLKVCR